MRKEALPNLMWSPTRAAAAVVVEMGMWRKGGCVVVVVVESVLLLLRRECWWLWLKDDGVRSPHFPTSTLKTTPTPRMRTTLPPLLRLTSTPTVAVVVVVAGYWPGRMSCVGMKASGEEEDEKKRFCSTLRPTLTVLSWSGGCRRWVLLLLRRCNLY